MIKQRTVLVLGAGASSAYGLPLGRGLRDLVCDLEYKRGAKVVEEAGFDEQDLYAFLQTLKYPLPSRLPTPSKPPMSKGSSIGISSPPT